MTLLIASVFPVVIFLYMIFQKDHDKEPLPLLIKTLFGGCCSVIISLSISFLLNPLSPLFPGPFLQSFFDAFFQAAIPEEIAKFSILYFLIWKNREFNHHYDGIVYAVFVSLGFALIENILYVLEGGMSVAIVRAIFSVPGHGLFGVLMGYYFSLAKFHESNKRIEYLIKSVLIAIIFHGGYDFVLMYMSAASDFPIVSVLLLIAFAWIVIKLWRLGISKINKHLSDDRENIQQF